jgi:hypothetical protein
MSRFSMRSPQLYETFENERVPAVTSPNEMKKT